MSFERLPLDDELEIRSLFARYGHLADVGNPAFVDLFTEDATWTRANSPAQSQGGSGLPPETIRGHAKLLVMMSETMLKRFKGLVHHQMTDFYVEPGAGANEAVGHSRALITDWRDGPGKIAMFGTYTTHFTKTTRGWRIRDIVVEVLPKGE
jgi:hypothetical protein